MGVIFVTNHPEKRYIFAEDAQNVGHTIRMLNKYMYVTQKIVTSYLISKIILHVMGILGGLTWKEQVSHLLNHGILWHS